MPCLIFNICVTRVYKISITISYLTKINCFQGNKTLTCEYIGTLSESAIAIFNYTCDWHNVWQRGVRDRLGYTSTTHIER